MAQEHERKFWLTIRQALLMVVDAIEQWWSIAPRTSRCRAAYKKRYGD